MRPNEIAFVRDPARFPGLSALLEEHIKDYREILPHLFFNDVTDYILSLLNAGELPQRRELRDILNYLEQVYASDEQLQELISVSFLESLPRLDEAGAQIRRMVGPHLTKQLHIIG
jgi:hypothetical protein